MNNTFAPMATCRPILTASKIQHNRRVTSFDRALLSALPFVIFVIGFVTSNLMNLS